MELLLVVAIVAVISAVAIPKFADANARNRLDAAVARLQADVRLARARARSTGVPHRVQADTGEGTYAVFTGANASAVILTAVDLTASPFNAGLKSWVVSDGGSTMLIDAYGQPLNGVTAVVTVGARNHTVILSEAPLPAGPDAADPGGDRPILIDSLPAELRDIGK